MPAIDNDMALAVAAATEQFRAVADNDLARVVLAVTQDEF
jgi:hypothetical protein